MCSVFLFCAPACDSGSRCTLHVQKDAGEFVDLYMLWRCSTSSFIMGSNGHVSIQMNMAEVDKVTGRFNGQFKIYTICGVICRLHESDDSILHLAKANIIISKNF
ncbi:40S ribosomal protein S21-like [Ursus americanus]|uniref:Small ribosomal subunit protein eS21 n=1 Tax=Ursus maritimus TaxID=29073 RepID=A0A8M1FRW9_URSMA|nr:40S ribosomal protein S21-like [Ursus maritimus]XP_045665288.1 40S ribosomal protein S21-like [Ursus americanus]